MTLGEKTLRHGGLLKEGARAMDGRTALLELFHRWDSFESLIPMAELRQGLSGLTLELNDVIDCTIFSDVAYQRVLIHQSTAYEALVLCWRSGQRSPIHDHKGSICAVYIIEGTATETIYAPSPCGRLFPAHSRSAGPRSLCVSQDADIHQMGNLQPEGRDLVSLHLYSPPLSASRIYSIDDTTLGGHDVLSASRPQTILSEIRVDGPHALSPKHPTRVRQVTP